MVPLKLGTALRRLIRNLLIVLPSLLVVFTAFAVGVGIYAAVLALWPVLRVSWPWLLGGAAAVVAVGVWWLWWRLPKWQAERLRLTIRDPKARADVEDNFRKTIGQLLGGAAVLIGAGFAYLQFQQQQQASHDVLISNQVSKGFEQLGNNKIATRLGGIYALEGVMNTSPPYYRPVLEALCAFVRESTKTKTTPGENPPPADIQAALTVIARRQVLSGIGEVDLTNARIPSADLLGAHLRGAFLNDTDLSGAHLSGADLTGADLRNADLRNAHLIDTNLRSAALNGANLNGATLEGANLANSHLTQATLIGGNLTQEQLDQACGTDVKLDPPLALKPCR
jgi:uncharacterized protein YjbI with pentapeptide repeats